MPNPSRAMHADRRCGLNVWMENPWPCIPIRCWMRQMLSAVILQKGHILAIKGLGGFQLACDATREEAVSRLRALKHREGKPLALMARDLEVIRRYCVVGKKKPNSCKAMRHPLSSLKRHRRLSLAPSVAPGMSTYGCMLPNSPLHHLILHRMAHPIVLTSGNHPANLSGSTMIRPEYILKDIAEFVVLHDRGIAQRVDDSVVKVMDQVPRVLRRSRGYAPMPVWLPRASSKLPRFWLWAVNSKIPSAYSKMDRPCSPITLEIWKTP